MKKTLLALAMLGSLSMNAFAADMDFSKLSEKDKEVIGKIASDYIVANPQVLVQASKQLQVEQQKQREAEMKQSAIVAVANKDELINDKNTPYYGGGEKPTLAVVQFFDYNCVYCSKTAPELEKVIANNKDVKFVFKELPIFASRFPESQMAAEVGMKVYQEKGSEGYIKYHNAIYETGHFEGNLTKTDVESAARLVGVDPKVTEDEKKLLNKNIELATKLNIRGTPSFVFIKTSEQTAENTLVVGSALDASQLQEIIDQLKKTK